MTAMLSRPAVCLDLFEELFASFFGRQVRNRFQLSLLILNQILGLFFVKG